MAVEFNPQKAQVSQSYAYKCWYNYEYEKNTMGISEEDFEDLSNRWKTKIDDWETSVEKDNNDYEISDDELSNTDFKTEEDDDKAKYNGMKAMGGVSVAATASILGAVVASIAASSLASSTFITIPVACSLNFAVATLYYALKPNKDTFEELNKIKDEILAGQDDVAQVQEDMEKFQEELLKLSEEAEDTTEGSNEEAANYQQQIDSYKSVYQQIIDRANAGEQLSESDKEMLKEIAEIIGALAESISAVTSDAASQKADIQDKMADYNSDYENAFTTMDSMTELTDLAAQFDEATQDSANQLGKAMAMNAASSFADMALGIMYSGFLWFLPPLSALMATSAALAGAAAGMSTAAAVEQNHMADNIGQNIDIRKTTEDINAQSQTSYDSSVDQYDGYTDIVDSLGIDEYSFDELSALPEITETPSKPEETGETGETGEPDNTNSNPDNSTSDDLNLFGGNENFFSTITTEENPEINPFVQ